MKFALVVLLGLCAVVAQASVIRDDLPVAGSDITEGIRQKVEASMAKAREESYVAREKVRLSSEKGLADLQQVFEQGQAKFAQISKQVEDKVDELKQKGGLAKECVEKHQAELEAVKQEAEADLNKCTGEAGESYNSYVKAIRDYFADIQEHMVEVYRVTDECGHSTVITPDECVYGKLDEINANLKTIFDGFQDVPKFAQQKTDEMESDGRECIQAVYTKSAEKLKEIHDKVAQCYQDGQKN